MEGEGVRRDQSLLRGAYDSKIIWDVLPRNVGGGCKPSRAEAIVTCVGVDDLLP
jgi:hypothetical protein